MTTENISKKQVIKEIFEKFISFDSFQRLCLFNDELQDFVKGELSEDTEDTEIEEDTEDNIVNKTDYNNFFKYNIDYVSKLDEMELVWLHYLAKKFDKDTINLVDEESGVEFGAYSFYYNGDKKLCIVNPR